MTLHGDAVLENGFLKVSGQGYAESKPFDVSFTEKTMAVWVKLSTLQQSLGAPITIEATYTDAQGTPTKYFDTISFGEREPNKWLTSSEEWSRTKAGFEINCAFETDVVLEEPIHMIVTYSLDKKITLYRNGVQWGDSYPISSLQEFRSGFAIVKLGLNNLKGEIHDARIWDRSLTPSEVLHIYKLGYLAMGTFYLEAIIPSVLIFCTNRIEESLWVSGAVPQQRRLPWKSCSN
jgi:hypothetical protein